MPSTKSGHILERDGFSDELAGRLIFQHGEIYTGIFAKTIDGRLRKEKAIMRTIVVDLINYVAKRPGSGMLNSALKTIGETEVRIIAIKLLGWFKEQARSGRRSSLHYNEHHTWCRNLNTLVTEIPELNELLLVDGRRIDFSSNVSDDDRVEITEFVDAHYSPRLRTSKQ